MINYLPYDGSEKALNTGFDIFFENAVTFCIKLNVFSRPVCIVQFSSLATDTSTPVQVVFNDWCLQCDYTVLV